MAIDGDNGASTVGGGNTGYNWSGYAEWLAKTKNSTKTCNLIVNYYANGYNGSAAENPPPSSVRSYTGQSVDVRLVVEVASGDTMSNPGYVFVGWATSNNTPTITYNPGDTISNSWASDYRGNSITNLYAVWTNQNVITYNPDDNSIEKSAIYQVKQSGQSATLKGATFTRTGYTQTGWAITAGGPKVYNLGGTYSSNNPLSLYPVWQANTYTITYVANEGTGTMADQTVTYDSTFTPSACSFTREGYSFSSWNESQDGKGIRWKVQEYTVDRAENITLYAIWKGNEYTVYYDDNYSRYSDEITGDIVTFESEYAQPLKKAEVSLSPIQSLNGYSSPWIGTDYDQQPYNFRAVSSSSVSPLGNSEMGNIVGGTVAWNQLVTTARRAESVTPDGTYTYSTSSVTLSTTANHVYFIAMTVKNYNGGKTLRAYCQINNTYGMPAQDLTGTSKAFAWLCKPSTGSASINYGLSNLATADKLTSADAWTRDDTQVIDLTAMFGSTIADYLYGLESGTAGAGIAKLKSWGYFTKPYYAYDAGSLQSVNTSAHKTYKADNTLLGNYALDSSLTLRGIPKLDANNNLYYDGDVYESSGTVTRKYGTITLDGVTSGKKFTGTWGTGSSNPYGYTVYITFVRTKTSNVRCDKFVYSSRDRDNMPLYSFVGDSGAADTWTFVLPSTITSLAEANTWLSNNPTTIVYELATPTTESATSYAATQSIDPDGTEEYVDYAESQGTRDVAIPVGHYTNYANICPISGRTGVSVYRTGKNLYSRELSVYNLPVYAQNGTSAPYPDVAVWWIKVNPSTKYTISLGETPSSTTYVRWINCDENKGFISRPGGTYQNASLPVTITTPSGCYWAQIAVNEYQTSQISQNDWKLQIEESDTATSYEAFGTTYAIDWTSEAGTVYGGTLDVVTGVLTVDRGIHTFTGKEAFNVYGSGANKSGRWVDSSIDTGTAYSSLLVCNSFMTATRYNDIFANPSVAINGGLVIHPEVKDTSGMDAAGVGAYLKDYLEAQYDGGTPIICAYPLATPLTYQLTPTQVAVLTGTNNVWSDGGPITIVYALDEVPQNMPPSTAIFGDIFYTRRNQLSRFGLTFKGWNTVPDGSGEAWLPSGVSMGTYKRTEDAVWNVSHNVTLYAQWDPNVYPFGTVFFNGRNAQDLGIIVEELPSYYYAERAFNHKQVNGKNGDVILDTGRYENVKKVYKVACYDPSRNFYESAVALSTFLHSAGSDYIRLEDSYEPSSYRMAIYEETNEIENLLGKAGRCEITFNCMPQRFLLSGDEEITIPSSGYSIYNPTAFDAKPMIRIQGTGTVTINGRSVQVTENDNDMLVDCENQNAKDLSGADMNYFIYCDEFPILKPGFNTISYTETIDAVKITPRWWIL